MIQDRLFPIFLVFLLFFLGSCAGKNPKPDNFTVLEEPSSYENIISHYYLQPGDIIDIKFFRNPELNEKVIVRPDGRISLQLIDEVTVAGVSPPQLETLLNEHYTPYLKSPKASVIISSFGGQKVYIGGQVNYPGVINMIGRTTVVQAIFEAGGLRADANMRDVLIISRGADNAPVSRKINIKKAMKGKLSDEEILLKPYDMVYVPKSIIIKANEFIYHVYKIIPPNLWFGFSYELHREPEKID
jgi:protein involved in polysaccharide export with SLBB domain